ncbi:uncharacterized protein A4U43_C08F36390 [Asparagus officinalis]|nr:uncharacterized protein A4U43_C08F36390 [Asparagus officinalis]
MASMELEITVHNAMELKNVNWPNGGLLPYTKVFLNRVETGRYSATKSTGTDFSSSTISEWNNTLVFRIKEYHIPTLDANFRISHLLPPGPCNHASKVVVGFASLPSTHLFGSGGSGVNWLYGYDQGWTETCSCSGHLGVPKASSSSKLFLCPVRRFGEEEDKEEGVELKEKQKTEESTGSSDMDREDYYSVDDNNDDYDIV